MLAHVVRRAALAVFGFFALTVPDPGAGAHRGTAALPASVPSLGAGIVLALFALAVLTMWLVSGQRLRDHVA